MTPPHFLTDQTLGKVWDALPEARVVGGAVRDGLARRPVEDIDLATPSTPVRVIDALGDAAIKVVPTGLAHGTVTAVVDGRSFEVTTLRRDIETDGRHAVVAFTDDWRQDAARRDFTINAMSMSRDGALFDYFRGAADLAAGRVRFVGDPATRIAEDHLRILRYFRFFALFGAKPPDPATIAALRAGGPNLAQLSVERVWNELRRILLVPDPSAAIALMQRLGIWEIVLPEASGEAGLAVLPPDPILRMTAMLSGDPLSLAQRLKVSNDDRDRLIRLMATPHVTGSDDDLRRLLADHEPADLIDRTWLDGNDEARRRLAGIPRPVFPLDGRDLVAFGIPPGPAMGQMLRAIRQWWLDGGCNSDHAACLTRLAQAVNLANFNTQR